jgi:DNA-binding response OmpR family regulator
MLQILLIEDKQRITELTERGLEEQGFAVTIAFDGLTGKKPAIGNQYDIITTDIILPNINGIDPCKQIRNFKPDVPINVVYF